MTFVFRVIFTECLILLALCFSFGNSYAQQNPASTSYLFNPILYNPAFAGHYQTPEFVVSGSMQGASVPGAQKNAMASVNAPLYDERVGLGASVTYETYGVTSVTGLYGSYAYKLVSKNRNSYTDWGFYPNTFSLGLLAGVTIYEEDLTALTTDNDPNFATNVKEAVPGFGFGVYYSKNRFSIGISAPQLIKSRTDDENLNISRHYYLTSGVKLNMGSKGWIFNPRTLVKYVNGAPLQIDLLSTFLYRDALELSLGYRSHSSVIASTGMTFSKNLKALIYWDYLVSTANRSLSDTYGVQLWYRLGE